MSMGAESKDSSYLGGQPGPGGTNPRGSGRGAEFSVNPVTVRVHTELVRISADISRYLGEPSLLSSELPYPYPALNTPEPVIQEVNLYDREYVPFNSLSRSRQFEKIRKLPREIKDELVEKLDHDVLERVFPRTTDDSGAPIVDDKKAEKELLHLSRFQQTVTRKVYVDGKTFPEVFDDVNAKMGIAHGYTLEDVKRAYRDAILIKAIQYDMGMDAFDAADRFISRKRKPVRKSADLGTLQAHSGERRPRQLPSFFASIPATEPTLPFEMQANGRFVFHRESASAIATLPLIQQYVILGIHLRRQTFESMQSVINANQAKFDLRDNADVAAIQQYYHDGMVSLILALFSGSVAS